MDHITTGIRRILEYSPIYTLFQNLVGAHSARKRYVEEFIRPLPGTKILDIGCGPGSMVDYLPKSVEYVGFDLNPKYIASAKKKYKERGEFFCSSVSDAPVHQCAGKFDIAIATGILHHLDDDEAAQLFQIAHAHLETGGMLVSIDPVLIPNQPRIAKYLISKDRGQRVRKPEEYTRLAKKRFRSIETFILTNMLRVPYTHFVMRCTTALDQG